MDNPAINPGGAARRSRSRAAASILLVTLAAASCCFAGDDAPLMRFIQRFELFPGYRFDSWFTWYRLQKSREFKQRYSVDGAVTADLDLISFDSALVLDCTYSLVGGMGYNTDVVVLFDPATVDYRLITAIEYRFKTAALRTGVDHSCFHEVDQRLRPTVYWNLPFFGASGPRKSGAAQLSVWRHQPHLSWYDRLNWDVQWGLHLTRFFDIIPRSTMSGGHPFRHQTKAEAHWLMWRWRGLMMSAGGHSRYYYTVDNRWFMEQRFSFEGVLMINRPVVGYIGYTVDAPRDIPCFSKDRLLDLGLKFSL